MPRPIQAVRRSYPLASTLASLYHFYLMTRADFLDIIKIKIINSKIINAIKYLRTKRKHKKKLN